MSTQPVDRPRDTSVPRLGLRERKKLKTRWAIQEHALRLFGEQGYEATTVEQIAEAAEVSPSTFFRYFPTKEDVVVMDEYDAIATELLQHLPADVPPIQALRQIIKAMVTKMDKEELRKAVARNRLMQTVPALRARMWDTSVEMLVVALADRTGRSTDDLAIRTFAGAVIGAWLAVAPSWGDGADMRTGFETMDQVLSLLERGLPL